LTTVVRRVHHSGVPEFGLEPHPSRVARHRVFLPQALGADEFVRVTWHDDEQVVVFSQWRGSLCVAATPVRVSEIGDLAGLLVDALGDAARRADVSRPDPSAPSLRDRLTQLVNPHRRESA
jgi:hypothetical protein